MQVVIFCGGLGTRLKEETDFKPKPMVEIGGKPILIHIMKYYASFGFKKFILCAGYKGENIKQYFFNYILSNKNFKIKFGEEDGIEFLDSKEVIDWEVSIIDTGEMAQKGSRLKQIEQYIDDDTFMVTYGDGLCNVNLDDLLKFHKENNKIATITGINIPSRFGVLNIDGNSITNFAEKAKRDNEYINGGFFVFNKKIFNFLSTDENCDLELNVFDTLAKLKELNVYKHAGDWMCMDTIKDVHYLNELWNNNKAFWKR